MARQINDEGLQKVQQWEGCILFAYDDFDPPSARRRIQPGDKVNGTLTIGYGSTGPHVKPGMVISQAQAESPLRRDLARFERCVSVAVQVPLTENQFSALVSFCFNVGEGNFLKSTLLRKLNAGDYDAVPRELMKWVNSKGKRMAGLVNRRSAEAGLWAKGEFVASNTFDTQPQPVGLFSTETISAGGGLASTAIAAASTSGPLQWALALIMVGGFGLFAWWLLVGRKRA